MSRSYFRKKNDTLLLIKFVAQSRSVATNIAEAFRKRQYPNMFVNKLSDADAEATETQVWLDFSLDRGYLPPERHKQLNKGFEEVGKMLGSMIATPEKFKIS